MSGRCKACDKTLKASEIIWRDEFKMHEDLCRKCRNIIHVELILGTETNTAAKVIEDAENDGE